MSTILRCIDLWKSFNSHPVLKGINLDIHEGEIIAIIGPSGVGKSTLLRLIDLLDAPSKGSIYYKGKNVTLTPTRTRIRARRKMGLVLQKPVVFNTTVYNNVSYGLRIRGIPSNQIRERVNNALNLLRITNISNKRATCLSGGEQQRVALARTIVTRPEILLLDEATANLDPHNITIIENSVKEINKEFKTTILMATHNMYQAKRMAHRVAFMYDGKFIEIGAVDQIFTDPQHPQTRSFIKGEAIF
ncbi:MAG: ABC transporter ATP-binding protein [Candidatus Ranarchaeia archaeon]